MSWDNVVKWAAAAVGAIAGLFGGCDTMLKVLVAVMAIDYISGWAVAILGKSLKTQSGGLNSRVAWEGLLKKGLALMVVLMGALLDKAVGQNVFRNVVVWFYVANEGLSILENLAHAGVPFPESVKKMLDQIREKNDKPPDNPPQTEE